jgi:exopolyphosphatase/guanosine-5'-triphosphate,3'-diphosphate pyrophosphatase
VRIGALDLGSNSFHLLIVETRPDGSFEALVREKEMLRLGDVVARLGFLDEEAVARAIAVVRRFRSISDAHGVEELVAYGTAALREAANGPEATDRIEAETGVRVQVINGIREAQLVFEAVRASVLMEPAPVMCADLGGGSLELAIGDRRGLQFATSLHLGVGRLTAEIVRSDPLSAKDRLRLRKRVSGEIAEVLDEILERKPAQLVGTSGTFLALVRGSVALRDGSEPGSANQLSVSLADLQAFSELVLSLDADGRAGLPGVDARRAELLPAGVVVAECLLEATGLTVLTGCEWALREGMVLRVLDHHDRADFSDDPRAIRQASVLSLCRRSNWREHHSVSVARMATELFDGTRSLHGLGPDERELIELAGLLHDIGEHVSRDGHGRHGAYLIEHGGLRGFSPEEIRILSCLTRYHTRGRPRESFPAYEALSEPDRKRTLALLALLRIADGLDVSHSDIVGHLEATVTPAEVVLSARARGEAELEIWMFQRKRPLFEDAFGRPAVLELSHGRHDEFEADPAGPDLTGAASGPS